jgi:hypothetical protein
MLVFSSDDDLEAGMFEAQGEPLVWARRPKVEVFVEPGKKKPKPRVDISPLTPGALAINAKARAALGGFLTRFGQLLEMDCAGQPEYFYNVTNVIDCIDAERSKKRPSGDISKEAFFEDKVPVEAAVFKDPRMAGVRIYVNDAARTELERLIAEAGITGAEFAEPGPPPPRPRPAA